MKQSLKTKYMLAALLITIFSHAALMQAQTDEQIERFRKERQAFFEEKLELTKAEAEAFWPVYDDFSNRKMTLMENERNTFRYLHQNEDNMDQEELRESLDRVLTIKSEIWKLEEEYYGDRFQKVLPPEKVLKLFKVEWDFRRHLLREIRGNGQGDGRGMGRGQGRNRNPVPPGGGPGN